MSSTMLPPAITPRKLITMTPSHTNNDTYTNYTDQQYNILSDELQQWMSNLTGHEFIDRSSFTQYCSNGEFICHLLNILHNDCIDISLINTEKPINDKVTPLIVRQMNNVKLIIKELQQLGIDSIYYIDSMDLIKSKHELWRWHKILRCIHQIKLMYEQRQKGIITLPFTPNKPYSTPSHNTLLYNTNKSIQSPTVPLTPAQLVLNNSLYMSPINQNKYLSCTQLINSSVKEFQQAADRLQLSSTKSSLLIKPFCTSTSTSTSKNINNNTMELNDEINALKLQCDGQTLQIQLLNKQKSELEQQLLSRQLQSDATWNIQLTTVQSQLQSCQNELNHTKQQLMQLKSQQQTALKQTLINLFHTNSDPTSESIHTLLLQPIRQHKQIVHDIRNDTEQMFVQFDNEWQITCHAILNKLSTANINHSLQQQLNSQTQLTKKYMNQLMELQGNIRVFVRCKPLSQMEVNNGEPMPIQCVNDNELCVRSDKRYEFDHIFPVDSTQSDIYNEIEPYIESLLDGTNICVFAYGQTGSGKTYTMNGGDTESTYGVNIRTLNTLFNRIQLNRDVHQINSTVTVQCIEIYNEQCRDLLLTSDSVQHKLDIKHDHKHNVIIDHCSQHMVNNVNDVVQLLSTAQSIRTTASTDANADSSRSHLLLFIRLQQHNQLTDESTTSKIVLIDLAGSERIKQTNAAGQRLKEAQSINKSLSSLGDVINSLRNKASHIPYRNSKLTYILSDCLTQHNKTLMLCNISSSNGDVNESICSLQFAQRVRAVQLGKAIKHIDTSNNTTIQLKRTITQLEQELQLCQDELNQLKSNESIHNNQLKQLQLQHTALQHEFTTELQSRATHIDQLNIQLNTLMSQLVQHNTMKTPLRTGDVKPLIAHFESAATPIHSTSISTQPSLPSSAPDSMTVQINDINIDMIDNNEKQSLDTVPINNKNNKPASKRLSKRTSTSLPAADLLMDTTKRSKHDSTATLESVNEPTRTSMTNRISEFVFSVPTKVKSLLITPPSNPIKYGTIQPIPDMTPCDMTPSHSNEPSKIRWGHIDIAPSPIPYTAIDRTPSPDKTVHTATTSHNSITAKRHKIATQSLCLGRASRRIVKTEKCTSTTGWKR